MAVLNFSELADLRQTMERKLRQNGLPIRYVKSDLNAVFQAIENRFEGARAALSADIDAASSVVFTSREKRLQIAIWLKQKFGREGV